MLPRGVPYKWLCCCCIHDLCQAGSFNFSEGLAASVQATCTIQRIINESQEDVKDFRRVSMPWVNTQTAGAGILMSRHRQPLGGGLQL